MNHNLWHFLFFFNSNNHFKLSKLQLTIFSAYAYLQKLYLGALLNLIEKCGIRLLFNRRLPAKSGHSRAESYPYPFILYYCMLTRLELVAFRVYIDTG